MKNPRETIVSENPTDSIGLAAQFVKDAGGSKEEVIQMAHQAANALAEKTNSDGKIEYTSSPMALTAPTDFGDWGNWSGGSGLGA